jgi:hypothetical protein
MTAVANKSRWPVTEKPTGENAPNWHRTTLMQRDDLWGWSIGARLSSSRNGLSRRFSVSCQSLLRLSMPLSRCRLRRSAQRVSSWRAVHTAINRERRRGTRRRGSRMRLQAQGFDSVALTRRLIVLTVLSCPLESTGNLQTSFWRRRGTSSIIPATLCSSGELRRLHV